LGCRRQGRRGHVRQRLCRRGHPQRIPHRHRLAGRIRRFESHPRRGAPQSTGPPAGSYALRERQGGTIVSSALERPTLSREDIARRIAELGPWFHNLELAGIRTAPDHFLGDYPAIKARQFWHLLAPALPGCTVLDIGCNAGFYALAAKRAGAARVVGIDSDPDYLAQARFAAEVSGLDIEYRQLSVYDVAALGERFDVVLFLGVLYHLRHPLLALDLIHEHVAGNLLAYQSMQRGSAET